MTSSPSIANSMTVLLTNQRLRIWICYANIHTDCYAFYTVLRYDLIRCVVVQGFHTEDTVRIPRAGLLSCSVARYKYTSAFFNLVIVTAPWKEIHK